VSARVSGPIWDIASGTQRTLTRSLMADLLLDPTDEEMREIVTFEIERLIGCERYEARPMVDRVVKAALDDRRGLLAALRAIPFLRL
jgi:hypothetical protein